MIDESGLVPSDHCQFINESIFKQNENYEILLKITWLTCSVFLIPTWEQLSTSRTRLDFSSNKREWAPKQMALWKLLSFGRKAAESMSWWIRTASLERMRRLSNWLQSDKSASLIFLHSSSRCFSPGPNSSKIGVKYFEEIRKNRTLVS